MEPERADSLSVLYVGPDATVVRTAVDNHLSNDAVGAVVSVDTVDAALKRLLDGDISVVVCEERNDNGAEAVAEIRAAYPSFPLLFLTHEPPTIDEALAAGATDVFSPRSGVDDAKLLARRLETVSASEPARPTLDGLVGAPLDAIDDVFYLLDTDGVLRQWNEQMCSVTGYDDEELAGMHALDLFEGEDRERIGEAITDVFETGPGVVEADLVAKDGSRIPVEYSGALLTGTDGDPLGVVGIGRDVSERREREDKLLKLRRTVETITENAPVALFTYGSDGTVTDVRGRALEQVGLSPASGSEQSAFELFADHAEMRENIDQSLDGEARHRLVDIGDATFELWLQPLLDETGAVERVVGLVLDVTERERQAKMLRQIEANTGEVIWMSSPEKASMDFISEAYEDIWGRTTASLRENPTSFVDAVHSDDRNRVKAALVEQRENPSAYEETYRVVQPGGEVRWVHDRAAGVYENGTLERIVGVATDITERKAHEQELELKNSAIDAAPVGIAIHDATEPSAPITYVNEAFERVTGHDQSVIESEPLSILTGADTDPEPYATIEAGFDAGDAVSEVLLLYRADRTPFWARVNVAPVVHDGEPSHFVSFIQDVTESKQHEQEIERHLDEFSEVLADDLRTPLQDAKHRLQANDEGQVNVETAKRALDRAESLIDDLLTVHSFSVKSRDTAESVAMSSKPGDESET